MSRYLKQCNEIMKLYESGIYVLINKKLNSFYVGKSKNEIIDRIKVHLNKGCKKSMNKFIHDDYTELYINVCESNNISMFISYDDELKLKEYAIFIYLKEKGYVAINNENTFDKITRARYDDLKYDIKKEDILNLEFNLFKSNFKEVIINLCDKKNKKIRSENNELNNSIILHMTKSLEVEYYDIYNTLNDFKTFILDSYYLYKSDFSSDCFRIIDILRKNLNDITTFLETTDFILDEQIESKMIDSCMLNLKYIGLLKYTIHNINEFYKKNLKYTDYESLLDLNVFLGGSNKSLLKIKSYITEV